MARDVGFDGIKCGPYVTFKSALVKGTDEGKLVTVSANKTVALQTSDVSNFGGIVRIIDQQDKAASVQLDGFVTMPYLSTATGAEIPVIGWYTLVSSGVLGTTVVGRAAAAGYPLRWVVDVDTVNKKVTFLL